jgi:protein-ribulosamine 3-kinase
VAGAAAVNLWTRIGESIATATGAPFAVSEHREIGGGCINSATEVSGNGRRYFVKLNDAARREMFEAEAAGLEEILRSETVRVPRPVCIGSAGGQSWLVLENLELGGGGAGTERRLGAALAAMHRVARPEFGWSRDNTIGSTPQVNSPETDWLTFYREHRLRFQLELAARNGHQGRLQSLGERLLEKLTGFFSGYRPVASLLHGDLWGGNHGVLRDGTPVIFDPAVYYGDREADLAMTELFGGFSGDFHAAYREAWPLDPGYGVRRDLYNLYHVLNHLNLFGGGYRGQAETLIGRLLAEAG